MGTINDEEPELSQLHPAKVISSLSEEERTALVQGGKVPRSILLRLESLMLVRIVPQTWWLTNFGEYIKEMIVNKREMTISEAEAFMAGAAEMKALALKAVDEESELPGDPGPQVLKAIEENPAAALRRTVIATKNNIRDRIANIGLRHDNDVD